ncbi:hypothetical protein LTR64_006609 [Lithohypha guttulata]|uniref:uncharacterized protein n=1 Tax=Lithohypha guttulata TaxID=1690604 RepID=UPI002DDE5BE3|nr:hypothetical protein LTR51_004833 [Lithohypha guttulata]
MNAIPLTVAEAEQLVDEATGSPHGARFETAEFELVYVAATTEGLLDDAADDLSIDQTPNAQIGAETAEEADYIDHLLEQDKVRPVSQDDDTEPVVFAVNDGSHAPDYTLPRLRYDPTAPGNAVAEDFASYEPGSVLPAEMIPQYADYLTESPVGMEDDIHTAMSTPVNHTFRNARNSVEVTMDQWHARRLQRSELPPRPARTTAPLLTLIIPTDVARTGTSHMYPPRRPRTPSSRHRLCGSSLLSQVKNVVTKTKNKLLGRHKGVDSRLLPSKTDALADKWDEDEYYTILVRHGDDGEEVSPYTTSSPPPPRRAFDVQRHPLTPVQVPLLAAPPTTPLPSLFPPRPLRRTSRIDFANTPVPDLGTPAPPQAPKKKLAVMKERGIEEIHFDWDSSDDEDEEADEEI